MCTNKPTLKEHDQHQNSSCNEKFPCHHEQHLCLCFQMSQQHKTPFPVKIMTSKHIVLNIPYRIYNQTTNTKIFLRICVRSLRCQFFIYGGTCLIRHTKGPGKCVGLHRMSEFSGLILETEKLWDHKFLSGVTVFQNIYLQILV